MTMPERDGACAFDLCGHPVVSHQFAARLVNGAREYCVDCVKEDPNAPETPWHAFTPRPDGALSDAARKKWMDALDARSRPADAG